MSNSLNSGFWAALALVLAPGMSATGAETARVLDATRYHLGTPGFPEWQEFAGKTPHGRRLDVKFAAEANAAEQALFIRQRDVKQRWQVQLNGRKIGDLVTVETELVNGFVVPAGALKAGENTLSIVPPTATDDIVVGEITLEPRPLKESLARATMTVTVTDAETRSGLPCRITVVDPAGALMPLQPPARSDTNAALAMAVRNGVIYTREGLANVGVLPGKYTIYASRGFEYSVSTQTVAVAAGEHRKVTLQIRREVPTPGWVACDTHIHTLTHSGHGDATVDERMLTIAGEGIELPVATDHNHHTDYSEAASRTRLQSHFTPVIGNEVTTKIGHFNAFPVHRDGAVPDFKALDWATLIQGMRATPGVQVITLNHPRDLHGLIPLSATNFNPVTGEHLRSVDFGVDALEVITSGAMQSDIHLLYRDWFALLNRGYKVAAVGSSDTHDVSRFILGQGRTYVKSDDRNPAAINIDEVCKGFRSGKVLVSLGLLTQMTVNGKFEVGDLATGLGPELTVTVSVSGPSWVTADRLELYANGVKIRDEPLAPKQGVEKANVTWKISRPSHDVHLVAIATGPGTRAPFWEIPRPYQPSSPVFESRVIGSTNPIWVDGDGDGKFSPARLYAQVLVKRVGLEPGPLVAALANYDEAVAVQAARVCQDNGRDIRSAEYAKAFQSGTDAVKNAFQRLTDTPKK
jgi:hypothetical protein